MSVLEAWAGCGWTWIPRPLPLMPSLQPGTCRFCSTAPSSCTPGCRFAHILSSLYLECALLPLTAQWLSSLPLQSGPLSPLPPTLASLHLSDSLSPVHALILPQCTGLQGREPVMLSGLLFPVEKWARVPSSTVLENWILPPHPGCGSFLGPAKPGLSFSATEWSTLPPAPQ